MYPNMQKILFLKFLLMLKVVSQQSRSWSILGLKNQIISKNIKGVTKSEYGSWIDNHRHPPHYHTKINSIARLSL